MNKEYMEKIKVDNSWFWEDESTERKFLLVSDDLDGWLSAMLLLQHRPNWEIGGFISYEDGYYSKLGADVNIDNLVGIDISLYNGKCISNHVTKVWQDEKINKQDINLNNIVNISTSNYFYKYGASTFMLLYSLLGLKFPDNKARAIASMIDSAYLGFYLPKHYEAYEAQKNWYNDILDFPDVYALGDRNGKEKFEKVQKQLNLKTKLYISDKGIETVEPVDLKGLCNILNITYSPEKFEGYFLCSNELKAETLHVSRTMQRYKNNLIARSVTRKNQQKILYCDGGLKECI